MNIVDYLDSHLIAFLDSTTRNSALQHLVDLLKSFHKIEDSKAFYKAILEREKLSSTGIGVGVALPHAKLENRDDFFIAIGIAREGIDWKAIDKRLVRLIFLIGGPSNKQGEYLQLLSTLTTFLKEESVRQQILHSSTPQEVLNIFQKPLKSHSVNL